MSMRAGFEFTIATMDKSPIAPELVMAALALTPYADHFPKMASHVSGEEYFHLISPDELSAYFSDVHPEEFDVFFNHLTNQLPNTTFMITTYQHEATEMRPAGSDAWLCRGDKTVGLNWDLGTRDFVFMVKALHFIDANMDEFIEATQLEDAQPVLKGLLANVANAECML